MVSIEDEVRAQRPYKEVNNTAALTQRLDEMLADNPSNEFRDTLCIVTTEPIQLDDMDDDLKRELAFYTNAMQAVQAAQAKLDELGVPHQRPDDYFAEMVKTDAHMARVKTKLIKQQTDAKEAEERRKARDNKKFGKQFQAAKAVERAQKRKASTDAAKGLRKGRPDAVSAELESAAGSGGFGGKRRRTDTGGNGDAGGGKRFAPGSRDAKEARWKRTHKDKRNSKESATDGSGFNSGKWSAPGKGKVGAAKKGSAKQRPGKARRQQARRK
ncbi:hypothetical protein KFE25_009179 [Diacronema lutheri]|uniref:Eukaryotic rRNA processing n=1 Tax=Diacronema lutheri TaxID=2081491 RepID=A0A8J5XS85_DIALT|nr:hypothetical protein KFE25_009179 [Diacronema lutheri]